VPVIFHTGLGVPDELSARFPNLIVHLKPLVPEQLIRQLAALIEPHDRSLSQQEAVVETVSAK
jgi:hypothetical protein